MFSMSVSIRSVVKKVLKDRVIDYKDLVVLINRHENLMPCNMTSSNISIMKIL